MKILVKFPTRSRPEQFLKVLRMMVEMSHDKNNIHYLISLDQDDTSMNNDSVMEQIKSLLVPMTVTIGASKSKMEAINRDMSVAPDWDIVLLASDDMIPQVQGWDEVIREGFEIPLPPISDDFEVICNPPLPTHSLDQALWFFDGHQHRICTLVVMGRKRYERFGYLYHPSYISLWCDNEWTEVNQPKKFDTILFRHEHPAWGGAVPLDALYNRNEGYFKADEANFMRRKSLNFPI